MFGKKISHTLLNESDRSFVAETMQIEGQIETTGAVDLAGLLNGNANVKEMIIYETGSIKGDLYATKVKINGHVEGHVIADEVSLGSTAVIMGDITFRKFLKTEEGAEIEGYIKGNKIKKNVDEEYEDVENINEKTEFKKPTLVKINKKEAL